MTLTFDVDDLAARVPEMLAEVEAGHQVVLARGARPLARVEKMTQHSQEDVDAAIAELRENRKNFAPMTIDEIIEWKNEGRR